MTKKTTTKTTMTMRDAFAFSLGGISSIAPFAAVPMIADDRLNKAISARIEASSADRGETPRSRLGPFENVLHNGAI